jgi:hypothetical protein
MMLPCVLGAAYLKDNYFQQGGAQYKAAAAMAQDFGAVHGPVFLILTLLCGFIIMFPGQLSSMDGIARRWCDAFWSGSRRARAADPHKVKTIYYTLVAVYVTIGILVYGLGVFGGSAAKIMVFNANLANLAITCCILHTLYVNCRFLPPEFRPSIPKRIALVLAAMFYFSIFSLVTQQTIQKALAGTLFG